MPLKLIFLPNSPCWTAFSLLELSHCVFLPLQWIQFCILSCKNMFFSPICLPPPPSPRTNIIIKAISWCQRKAVIWKVIDFHANAVFIHLHLSNPKLLIYRIRSDLQKQFIQGNIWHDICDASCFLGMESGRLVGNCALFTPCRLNICKQPLHSVTRFGKIQDEF